MSLVEQLDTDFKQALKRKDARTLSILRLIRSAIKNFEIAKQGMASDEDVVEILQRELKQHKESLEAFEKAGRADEVVRQKLEIGIIEGYLLERLSSAELKDVVEKVIEETNASSMQDMGKVMGTVMPQVKGRADGDVVGKMVKEMLEAN